MCLGTRVLLLLFYIINYVSIFYDYKTINALTSMSSADSLAGKFKFN